MVEECGGGGNSVWVNLDHIVRFGESMDGEWLELTGGNWMFHLDKGTLDKLIEAFG